MRYIIISDIHSNLEALIIFIELLSKFKIDKFICLGDIVGYNCNPNECVKIISSMNNVRVIRGNHDRAVVKREYYDFSEYARISVEWTIRNLTSESYSFLYSLESGPKIIDDSFAICHGSLIDEDRYIFSRQYAREDFEWLKEHNIKLAFFGHTHIQVAYSCNMYDKIEVINSKKIKLQDEFSYLINPGSIGQPRDGNPLASFAIYDTEEETVEIIRYEYNIEETQRKILKNHLPEFLAVRLMFGK